MLSLYFTVRSDKSKTILELKGAWEKNTVELIGKDLDQLQEEQLKDPIEIDFSALTMLDTVGVIFLKEFLNRLEANDHQVVFGPILPIHQKLLDAALTIKIEETPEVEKISAFKRFLIGLGVQTDAFIKEAKGLIGFFGLVLVSLGQLILGQNRFRLTAFFYHIKTIGFDALPIVGLLNFLIGVVLAYQGSVQLQKFGAQLFVVNLLGVSILREIGVLMTAIIIAGRSGSAFTAQIGTMQVTQEIDAMRSMGFSPIHFLVIPRLIALIIALPLLSFFADIVGLLGGAIISYSSLDISFTQFFHQLQTVVSAHTLWVGLCKAPVFAAVITIVGCYQGFNVPRSAEGIGLMTTKSVVQSIFIVIALDAGFSVFFSMLDI